VEASALYGARLVRLVNGSSEGQTIEELFMTSQDVTKLISDDDVTRDLEYCRHCHQCVRVVTRQPRLPDAMEGIGRQWKNFSGITFDTISTRYVQS
jgi:hypothetical protein